jgi:arylformamidase
MLASIEYLGKFFKVDLSKPIDISIPMHPKSARAWYVDPVQIEPVMNEKFIGSVEKGGNVNFRNIFFNPHGHGTHTETVGHISKEIVSINKVFNKFFFVAELISVIPENVQKSDGKWSFPNDTIISKKQLESAIGDKQPEALVIRTMPNEKEKLTKNYSGQNSTYITQEAMRFIVSKSIQHLLIDLPSVDREVDGGELNAHHIFWNFPAEMNSQKTITEFIFVSNQVSDGSYLLSLSIAPFENDASPSKPILYKVIL